MPALGLNRFTQAYAVAVCDAGVRIGDKPISCVDRLAWRLFEWGGGKDLNVTFNFVYPFVGGTAVSHSFNLADPSIGRIEWTDGVTHNQNGIVGDGVSGVGKTGVTLAGPTAADAYVSFGVYSRTASSGNFVEFSNYVTVGGVVKGGLYITARNASGNFVVYAGTTAVVAAVGNSQGLFAGLRAGSSGNWGFRNGVAFTSVLGANPAVDPPVPMLLLAHRVANTDYLDPETEEYQSFSNRNLAFAFLSNKVGTPGIGAIFSTQKQTDLYTYVQGFQSNLNRNV